MPLFLYDTLSREKKAFEPTDRGRVTLYVCGPTVYNYAHIGNARPVVVFDVLFRLLRRRYGEDHVVYARNVTDVDDKINQAAIDQDVDISVITDRFAAIYEADMAALNALTPTHQPRATAHIGEMTVLIEDMIQRGLAYVSDGEVLFDVRSYDAGTGRYGALSGRSLDDMIAGARVEVADNKRHPADFVLWKPSKPAEPEWTGPRGLRGRPGWHIECSAMAETLLDLPIDIHGGGHDLIFPHHTNEIAQSCAAHGLSAPRDYARYWMHNGFLDFSGEKMSKSLGNVVLVHDLVKRYPGEAIRWALLSGHYRAPLDWTEGLIEQSRATLNGLYQTLRDAKAILVGVSASVLASGDPSFVSVEERVDGFIQNALDDDLNTPRAYLMLADAAGQLRSAITAGDLAQVAFHRGVLLESANLLGFLQSDPEAWFQGSVDEGLKAKVETLLGERLAARQAKDWTTADRIREALNALDIVVMDGPEGATWRRRESDPT
jgi:cysteinyl-tRNA synthetase